MFRPTYATLIDNVFTNALYQATSGLRISDIRDHLPIFVRLQFNNFFSDYSAQTLYTGYTAVCIHYYVWWLNENIPTAAARLWPICWVLVFNIFTLSLWWIISYQSRSHLASASLSVPFSHFLKLYVLLLHTDVLYVASSMWHLHLCHPIFNPSLGTNIDQIVYFDDHYLRTNCKSVLAWCWVKIHPLDLSHRGPWFCLNKIFLLNIKKKGPLCLKALKFLSLVVSKEACAASTRPDIKKTEGCERPVSPDNSLRTGGRALGDISQADLWERATPLSFTWRRF